MALSVAQAYAIPPDYLSRCLHDAAAYQKVSPQLLWAIAKTESGFRTVYNYNRDRRRSYDIGVMQINSTWLPTLARHGIAERHLLEPCRNIYVGAWVLAGTIRQHGYTWKAVGAYHSPTVRHQVAYVARIQRALDQARRRSS